MQFIMSKDKLIEEVRNVIVDSHLKGSRGSHNRVKYDANAVGVRGVSQSKFDRELIELKERLSLVTELFQEGNAENQLCGWKLRRKMKLPIENLYAKNLKHKFSVWVNEEENLNAVDHEEEVHIICDSEQGVYLDEE